MPCGLSLLPSSNTNLGFVFCLVPCCFQLRDLACSIPSALNAPFSSASLHPLRHWETLPHPSRLNAGPPLESLCWPSGFSALLQPHVAPWAPLWHCPDHPISSQSVSVPQLCGVPRGQGTTSNSSFHTQGMAWAGLSPRWLDCEN